jgi:CBS domain-containing protein
MRAKDVMTTPVVTVSPSTRLKDVAALFVERGISAVPVVDEADELIGIVSEYDLVPLEAARDPRAHVIPIGHAHRDVPRTAAEVMTREVVCAPPDADAGEIARLMLKRGVKSIPIVEGKWVVGIVSRRDLLRVLARSDPEIRAELDELFDDEIGMLGRFEIDVSDGVVTVRGHTDREGRHLAEVLARSVPGVVEVEFEAA